MTNRPRDNSVPYLSSISAAAAARHDVTEIRAEIEAHGFWTAVEEWRISTTTSKRIEPVEIGERRWFHVSASCGHHFSCQTPTLERAVEMLGIYDRLLMDLFWTTGWPSWEAKGRMGA